jgi:ribonuclease VapC
MVGAVLDASALLAYLRGEAGGQMVKAVLAAGAVINAVNYAEVLTRLSDAGEEPAIIHRRLRDQGLIGALLAVTPLDEADGVTIARLRAPTRAHGLSLGDRACLATALRVGRPVITADRAWATVDVGVTVHLIRP